MALEERLSEKPNYLFFTFSNSNVPFLSVPFASFTSTLGSGFSSSLAISGIGGVNQEARGVTLAFGSAI